MILEKLDGLDFYLLCHRQGSISGASSKLLQARSIFKCTTLKKAKLIKSEGKVILKAHAHAYFPTGRSKSDIRKFHQQMISKASDELKKTDIQDFERRLMTGVTFSLNSEHLERLKNIVLNFLNEITVRRGLAMKFINAMYSCFHLLRPSKNKTCPGRTD